MESPVFKKARFPAENQDFAENCRDDKHSMFRSE